MSSFKAVLAGLKDLGRRIEKLPAAATNEAATALYRVAREKVEAVAIERCPMQDGILRGTIETLPPKIEGKKVTVLVVAGGPAAPYAIAVHEHLSEHSPSSWQPPAYVDFQVGGPKFLESALNDAMPSVPGEVGKHMSLKTAWERTK